jgi:PAS domain S-box-containing protein
MSCAINCISNIYDAVVYRDIADHELHPEYFHADRIAGQEPEYLFGEMPMWSFDPQTLAFLEVNAAAVRRYGYSREEFLDMTILDISPAEDMSKLLRRTMHPLQEHPRDGEIRRHRRKDGSIVEVRVSTSALKLSGRMERLVTVEKILG